MSVGNEDADYGTEIVLTGTFEQQPNHFEYTGASLNTVVSGSTATIRNSSLSPQSPVASDNTAVTDGTPWMTAQSGVYCSGGHHGNILYLL